MLVWKQDYDVKLWRHNQRTPNKNDYPMPLNEPPHENFLRTPLTTAECTKQRIYITPATTCGARRLKPTSASRDQCVFFSLWCANVVWCALELRFDTVVCWKENLFDLCGCSHSYLFSSASGFVQVKRIADKTEFWCSCLLKSKYVGGDRDAVFCRCRSFRVLTYETEVIGLCCVVWEVASLCLVLRLGKQVLPYCCR